MSAAASSSETDLAKKKCIPCHSKDVRPISEEEAKELLQQIPDWSILNEDGKSKLRRSWKVKNFKKGLELFECVADLAESEDHHPDLHLVGWNNVTIDIWTHAIGYLSENDFILAAKINTST